MAKYLPHGTTLSFNSVLVGGLITLSVPDRARGEAETTDSDSGGDREFIPGLRASGTTEMTLRHDPDDPGQQELENNHLTDPGSAVVECIITLPASATASTGSRTYTFDGFVTIPPSGDLNLADDEAAEQQATIRVTSGVTIA